MANGAENGAGFYTESWYSGVSREDESWGNMEIPETVQKEGPIPEMFVGRVKFGD